MNAVHAEQSPSMAANEDLGQVRLRRQRLGFKITELAHEAGISRDTLSDLEAGNKRPHTDTVDKVLAALDRLETEVGLDAPPLPPGVTRVGDPSEDLFAVEVYTPDGVLQAVVKGQPKDADIIRDTALRLMQGRDVRPPAENGA